MCCHTDPITLPCSPFPEMLSVSSSKDQSHCIQRNLTYEFLIEIIGFDKIVLCYSPSSSNWRKFSWKFFYQHSFTHNFFTHQVCRIKCSLFSLWRAAECVNCILNEALQCLAVPDGAHSFPEFCQIRGVTLAIEQTFRAGQSHLTLRSERKNARSQRYSFSKTLFSGWGLKWFSRVLLWPGQAL